MVNPIEPDEFPKFEKDEDGIPEIPRFSYSVPKEIRHEFIEEMYLDASLSPSQTVTKILILWYRQKRAGNVLRGMKNASAPQTESEGIPSFGPKPSRYTTERGKSQTSDPE